MAGKLIVDTIDTDNAFITLNVQQSLIATMNVSGIFSNTGVKMIGANGTVSNTAITGNITSSQITSVANTQITGNITSSQITSNPTLYGNVSVTGVIGVGGATPTTNGSGITFPASQSASSNANTLDDYEEGEWTPTYTATSGSFGTITYRFQQGRYTKVGRAVSFTCLIATDDIPIGTASGSVNISGMPFTNNDNENSYALSTANSFGANYPSAANTPPSQNTIRLLYRTTANGTTSNFPVTSLDLSTDYGNLVQIAGTFFVA